MALCELCGKEGNLFLAIVEGSQLQVCNQCSGYGKVIKRIQPEIKKKEKNYYSHSSYSRKATTRRNYCKKLFSIN